MCQLAQCEIRMCQPRLFWLMSGLWFRCGFGSRLDCGFTAVLALVWTVVSLQFLILSGLWFHCGSDACLGCGFTAVQALVWHLMSVDHTLFLLSFSVFAPYVCVLCPRHAPPIQIVLID